MLENARVTTFTVSELLRENQQGKEKPTRERKKGAFIVPFILSEGNFFEVFYLNVLCIEYTFRIYMLLHIKKITSYTFAACF